MRSMIVKMKHSLLFLVCLVHSYIHDVASITFYGSAVDERGNMLEISSMRWKSCSSCLEENSNSPEQIKMQMQDFKDNVDFHMSHFVKALQEKAEGLKASIDASEVENLKKACESVEDTIRETQAQLKSKCQDVLDSLERKSPSRTYSSVLNRVKESKELVKKFVEEGIDSLNDDIEKLKKEFSVNAIKSDQGNAEKDGNKNDKEESNNETKNTGSSLVDISNHGKLNSHVSKKKKNKEKEDKKDNKKDEKKESRKEDKKQSEQGKDIDERDDESDSSPAEEPVDHDDQAIDKKKEGESQDYQGKSYDNKNKNDKIQSSFKMSEEAQESFDMSQIPPTAITRTIQSYLKDLRVEAAKLLKQVTL